MGTFVSWILQFFAIQFFNFYFFWKLFFKRPCQGGGPMSPVWILKCLVLVFINACRLLSALLSLSQFGRGRLSLVAISFYTLSLLFGPCRLSELTLAGPVLTTTFLSTPKTHDFYPLPTTHNTKLHCIKSRDPWKSNLRFQITCDIPIRYANFTFASL